MLVYGSAIAQSPPAQKTPAADYQDAVYTGMISCSPSPDSEYCSNVADKFWVVQLNGKDYALKRGPSNEQMLTRIGVAIASPGGALILMLMDKNVLKDLAVNSAVQMRIHGGGVDVRVLKESKKGPRYYASHYDIAISQIEPVHHPPASH